MPMAGRGTVPALLDQWVTGNAGLRRSGSPGNARVATSCGDTLWYRRPRPGGEPALVPARCNDLLLADALQLRRRGRRRQCPVPIGNDPIGDALLDLPHAVFADELIDVAAGQGGHGLVVGRGHEEHVARA